MRSCENEGVSISISPDVNTQVLLSHLCIFIVELLGRVFLNIGMADWFFRLLWLVIYWYFTGEILLMNLEASRWKRLWLVALEKHDNHIDFCGVALHERDACSVTNSSSEYCTFTDLSETNSVPVPDNHVTLVLTQPFKRNSEEMFVNAEG